MWTLLVKCFHIKQRQTVGALLEDKCSGTTLELELRSAQISEIAESLLNVFKIFKDDRALRAHLILEEAAEVIEALADCNRIKLLDGLADLSYVTTGTAVTYNLPLEWAFEEVHASNMTKAPRSDGDPRVRDKGESYVGPDLASILECWDRGILDSMNIATCCGMKIGNFVYARPR